MVDDGEDKGGQKQVVTSRGRDCSHCLYHACGTARNQIRWFILLLKRKKSLYKFHVDFIDTRTTFQTH